MAAVLRGDVVWAELDPVRGSEQSGRRPVVILSRDEFNERSGTHAITSSVPKVGFPFVVELKSVSLPKRSWTKTSQVRVLAVERISAKIGTVSPEEMDQLVRGLNQIINV